MLGPELNQVADAVARERGIERDELLEAMEQAIQKAGRSKYGHEHDIRAEIDRRTGGVQLARYREVVDGADAIENEITQLPLAAARRVTPDAQVGAFLVDAMPPNDFRPIAPPTPQTAIGRAPWRGQVCE